MIVPLDKRPPSGPYSGMTARSAKRFLTEQFRASGVASAEIDAQDFVMEVTGFSLTDFVLRGTEPLTPNQYNTLKAYAERRLAGEPVDAILGWREFYGRRFSINADVLSPRGDTETLIRECLAALKGKSTPSILDMGTGSGAILITLLAEIPDALGLGTDISNKALDIAQSNAERLSVSGRARFLTSDWFEVVSGQFDLIVSNPPYITTDAMKSLEGEVLDYDPELSLHGGDDGLDAYRLILKTAKAFLKDDGALWVEIGFDQGESVKTLYLQNGFTDVRVVKDLGGNDRCVGTVPL
jgi:release factor glutamine methyltransferase